MSKMSKRAKIILAAVVAAAVLVVVVAFAARGGSSDQPAVVSVTPTQVSSSQVSSASPTKELSSAPSATTAVKSAPPSASSQSIKPSQSVTPGSTAAKPSSTAKAEAPPTSIMVGSLAIKIPSGYTRIDGSELDQVEKAVFSGPRKDWRGNYRSELVLSSTPTESADSLIYDLAERNVCPEGATVKPEVKIDTIVYAKGALPGTVTRSVFRCPEAVFTLATWNSDSDGLHAWYFGIFERRPAELTQAFQNATILH